MVRLVCVFGGICLVSSFCLTIGLVFLLLQSTQPQARDNSMQGKCLFLLSTPQADE